MRAYFDFRDELTIQYQLVFKGPRIIIPAVLRREMMSMVHALHIGIEGCIRRARDSLYWPRINADLKEYIGKCDICLAHQAVPGRESLVQQEIPERPWAKIGVDLCELKGRTLLVVCDYYSNFIEVEKIHAATTQGVSRVLKNLFSRYGIPDVVISDNGPQFLSSEFADFAQEWCFTHTTTSPYYPQSNGKEENAVKTIKKLFTKCHQSGQSEFNALLDWRNTPTEGMGTSPAQRFLGHRCKTLLPNTKSLLNPRYLVKKDVEELQAQKCRQKKYYNKHGRDMKPTKTGETVRMRLPGQATWSIGTCKAMVGPRSYEIQVGNTTYRQNRRHLLCTNQSTILDRQIEDIAVDRNNAPEVISSSAASAQTLCRSQRHHRPPHWMEDYVRT